MTFQLSIKTNFYTRKRSEAGSTSNSTKAPSHSRKTPLRVDLLDHQISWPLQYLLIHNVPWLEQRGSRCACCQPPKADERSKGSCPHVDVRVPFSSSGLEVVLIPKPGMPCMDESREKRRQTTSLHHRATGRSDCPYTVCSGIHKLTNSLLCFVYSIANLVWIYDLTLKPITYLQARNVIEATWIL